MAAVRSWDVKLLPVEAAPGGMAAVGLSFLTVSSWQEMAIASCTAAVISGSVNPVTFKLFIVG